MEFLLELILSGWASLQYYILQHTLTCLLPAFFLAGAMVTFLNREAILDLLGEQASPFKSFPLAAAASFLVAACSCTVIPVAAGLYFAGAGIGVAFIILWVAPAANILALVYTGTILGTEMVTARIVAALLVAFLVGLLMQFAFPGEHSKTSATRDSESHETEKSTDPGLKHDHEIISSSHQIKPILSGNHLGLIILILISLLAPNYLVQEGPYRFKVMVWAIATLAAAGYAWKMVAHELIKSWLRETWWFLRIIFPLLLGGVFLVGVIQTVLPESWVEQWLGNSTLTASLLATLIGAVSYFATMTEAPFVHTLMDMGMGNGPALTLLLTGPGISLPNWLAIARIFGIKKAMVYVPGIIVLGAVAGWIYGNFF